MKIDWNEKPDGIDIKLLQEFMKRSVPNKDVCNTDFVYNMCDRHG